MEPTSAIVTTKMKMKTYLAVVAIWKMMTINRLMFSRACCQQMTTMTKLTIKTLKSMSRTAKATMVSSTTSSSTSSCIKTDSNTMTTKKMEIAKGGNTAAAKKKLCDNSLIKTLKMKMQTLKTLVMIKTRMMKKSPLTFMTLSRPLKESTPVTRRNNEEMLNDMTCTAKKMIQITMMRTKSRAK